MMNTKLVVVAVLGILVGAGIVAAVTLGGDSSNDEVPDSSTFTNDGLMVMGNANGDYVLDEKDKQIMQDVIDGKIKTIDLLRAKDKNGNSYCLADTNQDKKITEDDIKMLDAIVAGDSDKIIVIDTFGYMRNVPLPIERIACDFYGTAEMLMLMGVQDKIVAASHALFALQDYYLMGVPDMSKVYDFGKRWEPNDEGTAESDPDVWVVSEDYAEGINEVCDAVVIGLDTLVFDFDDVENSNPIKSAMLAGYIFGNVAKAQEYVDWYLKNWNYFYDKTKNLSDSDRPEVFFTGYGSYMNDGTKELRYFPETTVPWEAVVLAGGHNILDSYDGNAIMNPPKRPTGNVTCDFEWIVDQDYDYLFVHCVKYTGKGDERADVPSHGYIFDDPAEWNQAHKDIAALEAFNGHVPADNVYLSPGDYMNSASGGLLNTAMVAKYIHPDLFGDLDVLKFQQEYIDLMGFDFDLSKNGVFLKTI